MNLFFSNVSSSGYELEKTSEQVLFSETES